MLTFEKVIEVFKDYLTEDTRYEIVMTSHGYTVLEWDSRANGLVRNCAPRRRSCGMCCWIASPGIWNIKRSPQMEKLPWLNRSGSPHSGRRFWRSCNKNQQRPRYHFPWAAAGLTANILVQIISEKWKNPYSLHIAMLHYAEGGALMATLLIVEDDIDTNEAVCEYLQEAGHTTIPAFDGDEAITLFSENKIDLVVLDIMLPTITGLAVLNSIRKTSQVPVLMLTAMEDEGTQIASFDGQADDYMTKPFSMVILGKRVAALLRRSNPAEKTDVWTCGDLTVNFSAYSAHDASGELEVTAKELDLLKLLVEHQGLVLSRTQILDGVWGDNSYVLDRLVDTYIKNLRKKLHLDCIKTVKGIGYKLEVSQ